MTAADKRPQRLSEVLLYDHTPEKLINVKENEEYEFDIISFIYGTDKQTYCGYSED